VNVELFKYLHSMTALGRSGDRVPVGARFSAPVQIDPEAHPAYNGYRVFPGGKMRPGRAADHSPTSSAAVMEE